MVHFDSSDDDDVIEVVSADTIVSVSPIYVVELLNW